MSAADWRAAGSALAPLDDITVLLFIGDAPVPLAAVARGAAAGAANRRVAVFDLAGAFGVTDPDGIVAALRDGRSLNALARPLDDGTDERFLVPRGGGELDVALSQHDRWPKLVEGFRASGALLVLLVPTGCEGIGEYVSLADRAFRLTMRTGRPGLEPWVVAPPAPPEPSVALEPRAPRFSPVPPERQAPPILPAPPAPRNHARAFMAGTVGVVLLGGAAGAWAWSNRRAAAIPAPIPPIVRTHAESLAAIDAMPSAIQDTLELPVIVNPGDSSRAAKWGVELVATNDRTDANFRLAESSYLPAGTLTPVLLGDDSAAWYKIVAGAFVERTGAELLRATLRQNRSIEKDAGVVARVPLALQLETSLTPTAATARAVDYGKRGIAAYALSRDDGTATVYTGAFASPEQAVLLIAELRRAGLKPDLSFRVGRTY